MKLYQFLENYIAKDIFISIKSSMGFSYCFYPTNLVKSRFVPVLRGYPLSYMSVLCTVLQYQYMHCVSQVISEMSIFNNLNINYFRIQIKNYSGCMDVFWSLFDISADLQCPDTAPVPVQSIHPTYQSCPAMHTSSTQLF